MDIYFERGNKMNKSRPTVDVLSYQSFDIASSLNKMNINEWRNYYLINHKEDKTKGRKQGNDFQYSPPPFSFINIKILIILWLRSDLRWSGGRASPSRPSPYRYFSANFVIYHFLLLRFHKKTSNFTCLSFQLIIFLKKINFFSLCAYRPVGRNWQERAAPSAAKIRIDPD